MKLVGIAIALAAVVALGALGGCANESRNDSIRAANKGAEAYGKKEIETAISNYKRAVELWRAHYYIGRIYRDTGRAKEAAEELTRTLQAAPTDPGPWVALAELYRQWDYTDQAIQIAEAGTAVVPGITEKADIWFEVGMGYDDKRLYDKAIDAYTKSLEAKRDKHTAKFQRGQAYYRKNDYGNAKRDLEEFSKTGGVSVQFEKQQAAKMLVDIAAKSVVPGSTPVEQPKSPEDVVKKGKGRGKRGR